MREDLGESASQNEIERRSCVRALRTEISRTVCACVVHAEIISHSEFARHLSDMRWFLTELAQDTSCYAWLVWSSKISVG